MATFSNPDEFKTYKEYVPLLKTALKTVKPGPGKKFLYYAAYKFTDKGDKLPLVLVDFDLNCKTILNTRSGKPTADGMVALNEKEELNFDAATGTVKRVRIKNYFGKMGQGIREVFVPEGEVDDTPVKGGDVEQKETEVSQTETMGTQAPPRPTQPAPQTVPTTSQPQDKQESKPLPEMPSKMDKRVEFANKQFALRERIEEIRKKSTPKVYDSVKERTLVMAGGLVSSGKLIDATKLLDQLVVRLNTPVPTMPNLPQTPPPQPQTTPPPTTAPTQTLPNRPPPPNTPPPKPKLPDLPPTPQEPKQVKPRPISTFFNSSSNWKAAKKTSSEGVAALQQAILSACDPDLKKLVEPKVKSLTSIIDLMDEGIVIKVQEAANETDEDRLPQRYKAVLDMANTQLNAIRKHPLGPAADKNPFGNFSICGQMEAVLTKMTVDFAV